MMRVVVLFSLLSGAILSLATGDLRTAELPLLYQLFSQLVPNDILLGDRGFGNFVLLALLAHLKPGVDFIGRSAPDVDGRHRLRRLGKDDWLVVWKKGTNPSLWLPRLMWMALPKEITLRRARQPPRQRIPRAPDHVGYHTPGRPALPRTRDPPGLPAALAPGDVSDDLKTTLEMEMLRSRSPEMLHKEIHAHLNAHNLIRCTMAHAAERRRSLGANQFQRNSGCVAPVLPGDEPGTHQEETLSIIGQAPGDPRQRFGARKARATRTTSDQTPQKKYPHLNKPRHSSRTRPSVTSAERSPK